MTDAPISQPTTAPRPPRRSNAQIMVICLGVVLFITLLVAIIPSFKPAIGDVIIGRMDDKQIVQPVATFMRIDKAMYCNAELRNIPEGYELRSRWVAQDVPGGPANEEISTKTTELKPQQHTFQVSLVRDASFPPGTYRLEFYLEPLKIKNVEPSKSLEIHVK